MNMKEMHLSLSVDDLVLFVWPPGVYVVFLPATPPFSVLPRLSTADHTQLVTASPCTVPAVFTSLASHFLHIVSVSDSMRDYLLSSPQSDSVCLSPAPHSFLLCSTILEHQLRPAVCSVLHPTSVLLLSLLIWFLLCLYLSSVLLFYILVLPLC